MSSAKHTRGTVKIPEKILGYKGLKINEVILGVKFYREKKSYLQSNVPPDSRKRFFK